MSKRLDARDLRIALHELTYVPWPPGKTKQDMLAGIQERALLVSRLLDTSSNQTIQDHLTDPESAIQSLHESIEVYVRGKPLEKKVERNESLVDRHMIP